MQLEKTLLHLPNPLAGSAMSASEGTASDLPNLEVGGLDLVMNCTTGGGGDNGTMQIDDCGGNATNVSGMK